MKETLENIAPHLFTEDAENVFALLDGASVPGLLQKLLQLKPEHECLYRGEVKPDIAEVAPYLVRLEPEAEFTEWVLEQGWGKHWGVFALSPAALATLRRHFRPLLIVHDADGKPLYFRYYDPRVLRTYLPTCNAQELAAMFGPVTCFIAEEEDPGTLLRFQAPAGALVQMKVDLGKG
jgi:hypothetical protein